eukprot:jgi/Botrbrau1/11288/Bobra.0038s0054.1
MSEAIEILQPVEDSHYVSGYEKRGIIGRGTFATVEVWAKKFDGQPAAIAVKRFNGQADICDLQMLAEQEAKILKNLRQEHDNIVGFREYIKHGEDHCLVLEYVKGDNILELIEQQSSTPNGLRGDAWYDLILRLTRQLLLGLQHLHEKEEIMHFDIKPENLLVTESGILKICDFGLSCKMGTPLEAAVNTIWYSAPELLENEVKSPSQPYTPDHSGAIDVWGVGCVVYEMLTGTPPFLPDLTTPGEVETPAGELETPAGELETLAGELDTPTGELETPAGDFAAPGPETFPDSSEQLKRIHQCIEGFKNWPPNHDCDQIPSGMRTESLDKLFKGLNALKTSSESIKFLKACWELNPMERSTCSDLLKMDFFQKQILVIKGGGGGAESARTAAPGARIGEFKPQDPRLIGLSLYSRRVIVKFPKSIMT